MYISIEKLRHHPNNPRKDLGDLTELAESIKTQGLICPLLVVPSDYDSYVETGTANEFFVIAGNRRLEACKLAGIENVYCEVANIDEETAIGIMLTENMIRQNLNTVEEAQGFQLMLDMGKDEDAIAKETGFKKETVRLRTKLKSLDAENVKKACEAGASIFDLAAVADIEDEKERNKILKKAGTRDFNNMLERYKSEKARTERMIEIEQFMRDHDCEEYTDFEYNKSFVTLKSVDADGNIVAERGYMDSVASYSSWSTDMPTEEIFEENKKYYFVKTRYGSINVYTDATQEAVEQKTAAEAENAARREKADALSGMCNEINTRHRTLREDFILNFPDLKKKQKQLKNFVLSAFNFGMENNFWNVTDRISKLYEKLKLDPAKATEDIRLLVTAYAILERSYYVDIGYKYDDLHLYRKSNPALDLLYAHLAALGYEISEEEQQIIDGTYELFPKPDPAEIEIEGEEGEEESA